MASLYSNARAHTRIDHGPRPLPPGGRQLARAISLHCAGALLLFALLQIWAVAAFNHGPGGRLLPLLALALLLLAALPFTRRIERRWHADFARRQCTLTGRYRRDRALLWLLALAVPPLWVGAAAYGLQFTSGLAFPG
jgi:hypothetical protein